MEDTFEKFVKKKAKEKQRGKIDWDKRKDNWVKSINYLFNDIKKWLEPFSKKKLLTIKDDKEILLNEEYIGQYTVPRLDIYIGSDIISLIPRGTLIVGSKGRIDMRGKKHEVMIIQPEWNKWKFTQRFPKLSMWELNEDSFKEIIQELV